MPFGFSGVLNGAARCFYAFIGFDIIATTGEEAKKPRESIPKAIIVTLIIVTIAYVSCASIMTLMGKTILAKALFFSRQQYIKMYLLVPYYALNDDAGLVQVWGQVGYPSVEWLISIGALAALVVSMFGSMFPMPRVAYAMAKDGLLFE